MIKPENQVKMPPLVATENKITGLSADCVLEIDFTGLSTTVLIQAIQQMITARVDAATTGRTIFYGVSPEIVSIHTPNEAGRYETTHSFRWPLEWEIADLLTAVYQMEQLRQDAK